MDETNLKILNRFRIKYDDFVNSYLKKLFFPENEPDYMQEQYRLLGHDSFRHIARGLFPYYSEEQEVFTEFYDLQLFQNVPDGEMYYPSAAILLTGEAGSGRRTVGRAIIREFFELLEPMLDNGETLDDAARLYCFEDITQDIQDGDSSIRKLEMLFAELQGIAGSEWADGKMIVVSMGDISRIIRKKKLMRFLMDQIKAFKRQHDVMFFFIGTYDGQASSIKEKYKEPFLVLEIEKPDAAIRRLYYSNIEKRYQHICLSYKPDKMAELTEGFTFGMLDDLTRMLMLYVKSVILDKNYEMEPYQQRNSEIKLGQEIIITSDVIDSLLSMVKGKRFAQPVKTAQTFFQTAQPVEHS